MPYITQNRRSTKHLYCIKLIVLNFWTWTCILYLNVFFFFTLFQCFLHALFCLSNYRWSLNREMTWLACFIHALQLQLKLTLRVAHPGPYSLVLEYASEEDTLQNVNILINGQSGGQFQARANIYSCAYRWVMQECASTVVLFISQPLRVLTLAAFCAGVLQWTASIEFQCCSFLTRQKLSCKRPLHHSCWWGQCFH